MGYLTTQMTVTDVPQLIATGPKRLLLTSNSPVFIGKEDVTVTTGFPVRSDNFISLKLDPGDMLFVVDIAQSSNLLYMLIQN